MNFLNFGEGNSIENDQRDYDGFYDLNGKLLAHKQAKVEKLKPGVYTIDFNPNIGLFLERSGIQSDALIDLPNTAYDQVVSEFEHFLKEETKEKFKALGMTYKRSSLLFGPPGTGKTAITNRIAAMAVKNGGIVLLNPNPNLLTELFKVLKHVQPESLVMVIFEELDEMLLRYEDNLLLILDGGVQRDNTIYLATTNFIEKVPPRIIRPGRFSSLVKVETLDEEARRVLIEKKIEKVRVDFTDEMIDTLIIQSAGMTIDETTELIKGSYCLNIPIDVLVNRIKNRNVEDL